MLASLLFAGCNGPQSSMRTCTWLAGGGQVSKVGRISTLLVAFMPRTTSERRISIAGSPCTLTTAPGRGGKFEAARSNFGDSGSAGLIKGAGLCGFYHSVGQRKTRNSGGRFFTTPELLLLLTGGCSSSLFRRVFLWFPLLGRRKLSSQSETVRGTEPNSLLMCIGTDASNWTHSLTFQM